MAASHQSSPPIELLAHEYTAVYAKTYLRGPKERGRPTPYLIGPPHKKWSKLVKQVRRGCILAPRGIGKSWFWSFAFPLHRAETVPGHDVALFSASEGQSEDNVRRIMKECEENEKLKHLLPKARLGKKSRRMQWGAECLEFPNGSRIVAYGLGGNLRGKHPMTIVADDLIPDAGLTSETVRQKAADGYSSTILPMASSEECAVWIVGTPFTRDDLYAQIAESAKKTGQYYFESFPLIDEKTGRPLWPERFSLERIAQIKADPMIGTLRFAREYMCTPISSLSSLFPEDFFKDPQMARDDVELGMDYRYYERLGITRRFMGVDFAFSNEKGADYTVVFTIGYDEHGNLWVLDIQRGHGLPFREQLALIKRAYDRMRPGLIYCEANQAQRIFGQELMLTTNLPVRNYTTGAEKHLLDRGVPSLRLPFENKRVRIPSKNESETRKVWISEMSHLTIEKNRVESLAGHDDTPMAFWLAVQASRDGVFNFAFGEQPGDKEADEAQTAALAAAEEEEEVIVPEIVVDPLPKGSKVTWTFPDGSIQYIGPDGRIRVRSPRADPIQGTWM